MDLFRASEQKNIDAAEPLAVRMRPRTIEEVVGQEHFLSPGKLLWRMLKADRLSSLIFYGPPGTGKTTLAHVIAKQTAAEFVSKNAISATVEEIRTVCREAHDRLAVHGRRTVLLLDEIHRFNRARQDVLLADVEIGTVILIGATTENPFFSVNSALVSRSTVFEFEPVSQADICKVLRRALKDSERGLGKYKAEITDEALNFFAVRCDGDVRKALSALEVAVVSQRAFEPDKPLLIDLEMAAESIQRKSLVSDKSGDSHYDLASALQKSMRGSDPDATVYWLARLIAGGEDPRFIARRICVCAAEDVGNADPTATILAAAAAQIAEFVGFPEAQLPLAQAAIYIACAPKSNASANAIWQAVNDVQTGRTAQVPVHLKDAHYSSAKKLGRGDGYKYPHAYPGNFVVQEYLPADFAKKYYLPGQQGREAKISEYLRQLDEYIRNTK
ncbi:MAG: replication-associated recombination protein A [Sedimentisphaerales bacterium]|nr:replication-associated recombination protein A [Sedimentisphaerales bacterium]MBN2841834.1 replication-associated recombination protein A [Sedimentisphaerales bacterium]